MTEEYLICRSGQHPLGIRCAIIEVILTLEPEEKTCGPNLSYRDKNIPILNLIPPHQGHDENKTECYAVVINDANYSFAVMVDQIVDQIPILQDNKTGDLEYLAWIDAKILVRLRRREANKLVILESIQPQPCSKPVFRDK